MSGRPWTPDEVDAVRRRYRVEPPAALARRIGRTAKAVVLMAVKLGLTRRRFRWPAGADDLIRDRHAAGVSDTRIAVELGCDRHAVMRRRRRLGLAPLYGVAGAPWHPALRAEVAARTRSQLERAGLPSIGHLRSTAHAGLARRYNLPPSVGRRGVEVVLALVAGPLTRRELAARCGLPQHADQRQLLKSNHPEGSYTAHLMALGLVARVRRSGGPGSGKGGHLPSLYLLTPACLDRLAMLKESL